MRGLKGKGGSGNRAASGTATAGLVAVVLFAAGCSTGGTGVQDEGAAPSEAAGKATPSPASSGGAGQFTESVDAVKLLMADPKVSPRVKADLRPCAKDSYPVDTSYAVLTGSDAPDVIVNVLTCGDAVGMGTYVYRENGKAYENVFSVEEPAVYAAVDRGDLVVTKQVYAKNDSVAEPSGEEVSTYRWSAGKFTRQFWVRNEFGRAVGEGEVVASEPSAPPKN
ncbi:hypothetical protein ABZ070_31240 [Streptomyces sp. NPDC006283]|uniref:hypothetical protein n=1 Tax=Streptomyces sp. NPDC006283 TaxID=3156741 RepID=UPI0033B78A61